MRHVGVALLSLLLVVSLSAATFELPTDAQLLARADAVVVATVLDSSVREGADRMLFTDHRLRVDEVLKGRVDERIVVSEAGGFAGGRGVVIAGSAAYEKGTRVLAFLRERGDGTWFTAYMALGHYRFEGSRVVRDAHGIEALSGDAREVRDAARFIDAIRSGDFAEAQREATVVPHADPPQNYVFVDGNPPRPIRWQGCESGCNIGYKHNGTQPGGGNMIAAVNAATAVWTNDPFSFLTLSRLGTTSATDPADEPTDDNTIHFNYPNQLPTFCDAGIACAIVWVGGTHTYRSQTWYSVEESDVVILPNALNQTALETVLAHELGHSLSFRDAPVTNALMSPSINLSRGAVLGTWDQEALAQVYGNGLPCQDVAISGVTGGGTVNHGSTATLTANATGDAPLTYQWYLGATGDTSTPVGTNNKNYTTGPITQQQQYWVRVSNACPSSANSATVTVTPTVCNAPVITTQPQSQSVTSGGSTTLHVAANGTTPFAYQWFRANSVGDTSNPVGTNSPNFTTPALSATTSYWVRVSNNCDSADSALATITVGASCSAPAIASQPSTVNVNLGEGASLAVTATGTAPLSYQWYEGSSGEDSKPIAGATSNSFAAGPFNSPGAFRYWVRVTNTCGAIPSQTITINVACPTATVPLISAPAVAPSNAPYTVSWSGTLSVTPTFELQESTSADFTANVRSFTVSGATSRAIPAHSEVTTETRFYYRVRAISACTGQAGAYSAVASTIVTPPLPPNSSSFAVSIPVGTTQPLRQDLLVPGFGAGATAGDTFSISIDAPWLTVSPQSGPLPAGGATVQLTINPSGLEIGSRNATIIINRAQPTSGRVATNATTTTTFVPFSVSLVTPVSPDPRDGNPPPGTLIIPAVANAQGIGSAFRSDVRIVNVSFDDIEYDISFTPSETDGTQSSLKTTVTIGAGEVIAFDDIVKAWYGAALTGQSALGTIEIRPLGGANPLATFASSRTFAIDAGGTLGQFIPALRLDQFIGNIAADPLGRISLQQVANSASYRTNIGFVEGTGSPATFTARLLNGSNQVIGTVTRDIAPFGHLQRNLTALFGNVDLADGRVEVEVTSPGGKVSAYASVLNNRTNDPLLVFPVQPARNSAARYVLAGIAEFDAGDRNFHSDMRIYNGGTAPVTVSLNYYDRGQSTPLSTAPARQITLGPGEVRAINDVLPTLWPGLIGGGSVVATAPEDARLVLTAQTYSRQPDGGTKGQFIPGVTAKEGTGFGERALEVLQLEQSPLYRSNVGFVEVTGKGADLEITLVKPDAKVSAVTTYNLRPNEYVQFDRILEPLGTVYNGRVSVRVIGGEGRVYAYGSTIDNRTEDPTYVPAQ